MHTGMEQNIQAKLEAERSRTQIAGKRDKVKLSHLTEKFGEYKAEKKYRKKEIWKEEEADEDGEGDDSIYLCRLFQLINVEIPYVSHKELPTRARIDYPKAWIGRKYQNLSKFMDGKRTARL